jgi:hypothetical protein
LLLHASQTHRDLAAPTAPLTRSLFQSCWIFRSGTLLEAAFPSKIIDENMQAY